MSNKNKPNNKKVASKPPNADAAAPPPPSPAKPTVLRGNPPPGRLKEFGKYMTSQNPVSFYIESTTKTGRYEVIAIDAAGFQHLVALAPNYDLASDMLRTCQDICNNELDIDPTLTWKQYDAVVSGVWDSYFRQCAVTPVDRVGLELVQSEPQRVKNLVNSFRTEPIVRFGLFAAARKDIKFFELCELGDGASWFVRARDIEGGVHLCATGGSGDEVKMSLIMNSFIALANQQYVDAELANEWSSKNPGALVQPVAEKKNGETNPVKNRDPLKKWKRVMKKRPKQSAGKKTGQDDDDVDDKQQEWEEYSDYEEDGLVGDTPASKKAEEVFATDSLELTGERAREYYQQHRPRNGLAASRVLIGGGEEYEEDDDDEAMEDANEIVRMADPEVFKKQNQHHHHHKPAHDGKLTLDQPTKESGIEAKNFAICTGTPLANGGVEVVGLASGGGGSSSSAPATKEKE